MSYSNAIKRPRPSFNRDPTSRPMLELQSKLLSHSVTLHEEISKLRKEYNKGIQEKKENDTLFHYSEYVQTLYGQIVNNTSKCTSWQQFMDTHILVEQKNICSERGLPFPQPFKWDTHIKILQESPCHQKVYKYLAEIGMSSAQFQKCVEFQRERNGLAHETLTITQDLKKKDTSKLQESFVGKLAPYMDSIKKAIDVAPLAVTLPIE